MPMKKYDKKPFPWRCSNCGEQAVYGATVDYAATMHHDGREYVVKVDGLKTPKCGQCGQVMLDIEALEFLDDVFISQLNLLTPERIQEHRTKAKLTQQELADALGVGEAEIQQIERGEQIQTRSMDNLLRLFFGLAQVREILTTHQIGNLPQSA
jgi:putative zinc finger/helix-turn-helix YgiT family protein